MKKSGRVVRSSETLVTVSVEGNGGANQPVAECCQVPTVEVEANNPRRLELQPGELVEISDGLGIMLWGGTTFLLFPAVITGLAGWPGLPAGLVLAYFYFRFLKVDQFPKVVRRLGAPLDLPLDFPNP